MFKVADETGFVIKRFEMVDRLEAFADKLKDPAQRAEQRQIALEIINDLGPLRLVIVGKLLDLMEKTAREWAKEGALRIEIHDPRILIDPLTVHSVRQLMKDLRAAGQTRLLLASVSQIISERAALESTDPEGNLAPIRQFQPEILRLRAQNLKRPKQRVKPESPSVELALEDVELSG